MFLNFKITHHFGHSSLLLLGSGQQNMMKFMRGWNWTWWMDSVSLCHPAFIGTSPTLRLWNDTPKVNAERWWEDKHWTFPSEAETLDFWMAIMGYRLFSSKWFNFPLGLVILSTSLMMSPEASHKQHWFEEGISPVLVASSIVLNFQNPSETNPGFCRPHYIGSLWQRGLAPIFKLMAIT